jgi:CRP/FNR family transcriptional regulator
MTEQELTAVQKITHFRKVARGEEVFAEGDPAEALYILSSGRVEIFKLNADGKKQLLRAISPGDMFAEAVMFSGASYPAFADATMDSELLVITRRDLVQLLYTHPQLSLKMLGALAHLLMKFNKMIEDLTLKEVPARVASLLLDYSEQTGRKTFTLDMKMGELAEQVGTARETLSRTMRKLRYEGIIGVQGKTITILNTELLEEVAGGMRK